MGKRVLIVGGVAGGASTAARLRRLDETAEIVIFERGGSVSFANCGLPYYISGVISERSALLVQTPESLYERFRIDVRVRHEVTAIDREKKEVTVKNLGSGTESAERYDVLVLSPGAKAIMPDIPGMEQADVFTMRSMEDSDAMKAFVDRREPKSAVVIGGGYIGLEIMENLSELGVKVTLVEKFDQILAPLDFEMVNPIQKMLVKKGIDLKTGCEITGFEDGAALLSDGKRVQADMAVVAAGVVPDATLARMAGLAVGERGGIVVDDHMKTSDDSIYAVGDAIQVKDFVTGSAGQKPLAGPANRQGRIAADNICGIPSVYKGAQGTSIVKIFDMCAAGTGANERTLKQAGIPYYACWLHPASHATYYPGSKTIALKVLFHRETGLILGAQGVGAEGVDKRIDVLATAIRCGLNIRDLQDLELSYAPPFASAKDPVNMAGYIGENMMEGINPPVYWNDIGEPNSDQTLILDVRTPGECKGGIIPGAVNIPVDSLRDRISELPDDKEKTIHIYCRVGLRGYIAARILQQNGYKNVCNLSGGWLTWTAAQG